MRCKRLESINHLVHIIIFLKTNRRKHEDAMQHIFWQKSKSAKPPTSRKKLTTGNKHTQTQRRVNEVQARLIMLISEETRAEKLNQTGDKQETQYRIKGNIRQSNADWRLLLIYWNGELFLFKDFESWIRTTRTTRRSTPLHWPRFKSSHDKLFMGSRLFVLSPLNTHLNICKRHQDEAESEYVFWFCSDRLWVTSDLLLLLLLLRSVSTCTLILRKWNLPPGWRTNTLSAEIFEKIFNANDFFLLFADSVLM